MKKECEQLKLVNKDNVEDVISKIIHFTSDYIIKNKIESLVLGISGGIDSAVVACLASYVCKETNANLIGVEMHHSSNKTEEVARAKRISCNFADNIITNPIDNLIKSFASELYTYMDILTFDEKIRLGNIKARIRMIILYHYAHKNNGIVLSTDNYSEYLLGFWTLHGDVGDFGMIQNLFKTEVYEIAKFCVDRFELKGEFKKAKALKECINAVPTDGLGITTSDFDQIDISSYEEIDYFLLNSTEIDNPINRKYRETIFKRNNPINIKRNKLICE